MITLTNYFIPSVGFEKYSVLGWSDGGIAGLILAAANLYVENLVIWGANAFVTEGDKELLEVTRDINNWSEKMRTPLEGKGIVMFYAIWYHLYNLKNVKNTFRGVLHSSMGVFYVF